MTPVRRGLVAVTAVPILLGLLLGAAACGSGEVEQSDVRTVTIVGQKFTEADIVTQFYRLLLDKDGFTTRVEEVGARDLYLGPLEKDEVQLSADYLSSMTEALNRARDVLNPLSRVLATADLTALITQVDGDLRPAEAVAENYLKEKGLL